MTTKYLVVEGQAGAGKTPLCTAIVRELEDQGLTVECVHPFHEVSKEIGFDLFEVWENEPQRAVSLMREILLRPRSADVILFDRGWMTMQMGLEGFGHSQIVGDALQDLRWWTVFVDIPIETVRSRASYKGDDAVAWNMEEDMNYRRILMAGCDLVVQSGLRIDMKVLAKQIVATWQSSF